MRILIVALFCEMHRMMKSHAVMYKGSDTAGCVPTCNDGSGKAVTFSKKIPLIMLALWFSVSASAQSEFETALIAYETGDYAGAIAGFENMLVQGNQSADVHYNLAVACYAAGDTGCAVLSLRRGLVLRPRDVALQTTLAIVRADANLPDSEPADPVIAIGTMTSNLLTLAEFAIFVFIMWCVCWLLLVMSFWLRKWRELLRYILVVPAIITFLAFSVLMLRIAMDTLRPEAVVMTEQVQVLSGPGEDFLFLYDLSAGTTLRLVETRGDWQRFLLDDGRQGWLPVTTIETLN